MNNILELINKNLNANGFPEFLPVVYEQDMVDVYDDFTNAYSTTLPYDVYVKLYFWVKDGELINAQLHFHNRQKSSCFNSTYENEQFKDSLVEDFFYYFWDYKDTLKKKK